MIIEEADNIPCTAAAEVDPVAVTMELDIERMQNRLNKHRIEVYKAKVTEFRDIAFTAVEKAKELQEEVTRLEKVISDGCVRFRKRCTATT